MTNERGQYQDEAPWSNDVDKPVSAEELAQFDEAYQQAETMERGASIPDGSYQVEVERVFLARTKSEGEPMLKWQFNVLGPTHVGAKLFKNHLFRPQSLPFLKTDLSVMGVAVNGPSEVPGILDGLIGIRLNIKKVTKGENENIYINSRIQVAGETVQGSTRPAAQQSAAVKKAREF